MLTRTLASRLTRLFIASLGSVYRHSIVQCEDKSVYISHFYLFCKLPMSNREKKLDGHQNLRNLETSLEFSKID